MEKINSLVEAVKSLDYQGISAEYILHNIADLAFKKIKNSISDNNEVLRNTGSDLRFDLKSSELTIVEQILFNVKKASNWCNNVSFKDSPKSKPLNQIYVDLDYYVSPKYLKIEDFEDQKLPFNSLLENIDSNTVILGGPGAGKTTLMKFLCYRVLNENLYKGKFTCPFVIRFREIRIPKIINNPEAFSLYAILKDELGIVINTEESTNISQRSFEQTYNQIVKRVIISFIEESKLLIILDGYDEIANPKVKKLIKRDLEELSISLDSSKFVITSRTGDFDIDISNSETYEVCPLSIEQIELFTKKWLLDQKEAADLFSQIISSPFSDTIIRPLTLAHLCAIYERYKKIPSKPKSVYSKVVQLLLEEWDTQRGIERISNYASFEIDRKIEFLSKLSYILTTRFHVTSFEKGDLESAYRAICLDFNLPISQMKKVINEIESHNGLFIQTGIESYEFAHKSIQEFLAAKYIVGLPEIPSNFELLKNIPNELAISIAISSDPNLYLGILVLQKIKKKSYSINFFKIILSRLIIEKPDYNDKPILLAAMFEVKYFFNASYEPVRYDKLDIENVNQLIDIILEESVLKKAVKKFQKIYQKGEFNAINNTGSYNFRDPNMSLGERNFLPFTLHINSQTQNYIDENS